jgi:cytochrome c peroxidase
VPEKHEGLYKFSLKLEDRGKFRIPPLRNVARTPPYMHDGSLATLEDVVKHYNRGGTHRCRKKKSCGPAPQKHALIRPLALTAADQEALVEFPRSLSTQKY